MENVLKGTLAGEGHQETYRYPGRDKAWNSVAKPQPGKLKKNKKN